MSETAAYQTRKPTRVRTLGDAVPVIRPFRDAEPKIVAKTADELRADREAARDAAPMAASCAVDGCTWAYTGTAGDCRTRSAAHRASKHPELAGRRTHRKGGVQFKRRGEEVDPAVVAESRRLRQERDDQQRLDTINRGRAARGETPLEGEPMSTTCKIDGCDKDASDAPKAGPTSKLCKPHRAERSAALSAARTGRPRGAPGSGETPHVTKTVIGAPPGPEPIRTDPKRADDIAVPPNGDGGSLATLAAELEDARQDVTRANSRWLAAIKAFKAHDVIQQIGDEDGVAA